MNVQELLKKYDQGHLTAVQIAMEVMNLVDEDNIESVLSALPVEVLDRLRDFVAGYRPGQMISIGGATDPGPERVACVRRWLDGPGA